MSAKRAKPKKKVRTVRTPKGGPGWTVKFLAGLAEMGVIGPACKAARVGRRTVYDHRDRDKAFAAAIALALEDYADALELEVDRRGRQGIPRDVYYQGAVVGQELEYSDGLLLAKVKAARPEKFRERVQVQHDGKVDGPRSAAEGATEAAALLAELGERLGIVDGGGASPGEKAP